MSRGVSQPRIDQLPAHVAQRLRQLIRRARAVALAKGVALTLVAALVAGGVAVSIDLFVPMIWPESVMWLTAATRTAITATALAVTLVVAVFAIVLPLARRHSLTSAAVALERDRPELQERISTTVELALSDDPDIFRGSRQMIRQVATAADDDSARVSPRQVIRARRAEWAWLLAGLLGAAAVAAGVFRPDHFRLYLQRFIVPWSETDQFRRTSVESLTASRSCPRGEPVVIEARSRGLRATHATLYIQHLDGSGRTESKTVRAESNGDGDPTFRFPIPPLADSFTYRVRANDGVTRSYQITAVDRPQATRMDVRYRFPDYTRRADKLVEHAAGPVVGLKHSMVTVRVWTNRPLDSDGRFLVFQANRAVGPASQPDLAGPVRLPLIEAGPKCYQTELELTESGRYHFEMFSEGLGSLVTPDRQHAVTVEPDTGPTEVNILRPAPTEQVAIRPDDKLPIGYQARDDFGVALVRVGYRLEGQADWQQTSAEPLDEPAEAVRAVTTFDLARLGVDLSAVSKVEYRVEVGDNLPPRFGGPQWACSASQSLKIQAKLSDYADRLAEDTRQFVARHLADIEKELRAALADVRAVRKAMGRQPMLDAAQTAATDSAMAHLTKAEALALAAAGRAEMSNYEKIGQRLKDVAVGHVQPANQLVGQSKELGGQPQPRDEKLTQGEWHIERALEKLGAVAKEFTDLIKWEHRADLFEDLTRKQQEIADKAAGELINDPKELARLTQEQMELLDKARELLREDREEAAEPLYDIAAKAQATLQEKIQQIAQQQKDLMDETARAQELSDLRKKAKDLARRQDDLARATEQFEKAQAEPLAKAEVPRGSDKAMAEAARQIDAHQFEQAQANQRIATTQLDQAEQAGKAALEQATRAAAEMSKDRRDAAALKQMADKARQLEQQQQALVAETPAAAKAAEAAARQADQAKEQADRQVAELAKAQQEIAEKAEQLRQEAAAKLAPADAQAAKTADPAPAARQAADQLGKQDAQAAAAPAQQAEQKARQLAEAMDQADKQHQQAASQAAAEAAATTQPEARQAAQERADRHAAQAAEARQVGEQARQLADRQAELNKRLPAAQQAASDARQQAAASKQAAQRTADQAQKQRNVAAEAARLQKQMNEAGEPTRKLAGEHDAAAPAAEAAEKLPAQPEQAAKPQKAAAERLGEVAKGLDELAKAAADKLARSEQAQKDAAAARNVNTQAAALKQRQQQLADETAKLAEQMGKADKELVDRQLADLARRQQDLAERAADLADSVAQQPADEAGNPQPPQPDPEATSAAAAAKAASDKLAGQQLGQAAQQQRQAEQQLRNVADQQARQAGQQAGVNPQGQQQAAAQAAEAARLAEQQRQLAEQTENLAKREPLANLPVRQEALKQQTEQLGEQAKLVADFMRQIAPAAGEMAKQAAAQLAERAPIAQGQAAQAMRQDQMAQARQAQQLAAAAAERAAEMFQRAAEQAAAAAEAGPADQPAEPVAAEPGEPGPAERAEQPNPYDPLAEAAWAQAQAQAALRQAAAARQADQQLAQALAQAQAAIAAQQASQQLGQAAQQMSQQVVSLSSQAGQPAPETPLYRPAWVSQTGSQGGTPDLRMLNFELGISSSEWNRLPGYLQHEILQAAGEQVPPEYRELVKRYFQAIGRQAGQR